MQVTIGSIAAALLGFAGNDGKKEQQPTENLVEIIAMILLPVAVLMVGYALIVFVWRSKAIARKQARTSRLPLQASDHIMSTICARSPLETFVSMCCFMRFEACYPSCISLSCMPAKHVPLFAESRHVLHYPCSSSSTCRGCWHVEKG